MIKARLTPDFMDNYVSMRLNNQGAEAADLLDILLSLDVGISRDAFQKEYEKAMRK